MIKIERHLGELAAAHRLLHHGGMCSTLHGHNFGVIVWVEIDAPIEASTGIAVDFLDFDRLREELFRELDHGIWLNREDPLVSLLQDGGIPVKLTLIEGDPTAENIGELVLGKLRTLFPNVDSYGVRILAAGETG